MSIIGAAGGATLTITMPTWVWAVLALLLILGVASMVAKRGRF